MPIKTVICPQCHEPMEHNNADYDDEQKEVTLHFTCSKCGTMVARVYQLMMLTNTENMCGQEEGKAELTKAAVTEAALLGFKCPECDVEFEGFFVYLEGSEVVV